MKRLSKKAKMCFSQRPHPAAAGHKKRKEHEIKSLILAIFPFTLPALREIILLRQPPGLKIYFTTNR
jgi:hypothetical protein